jgi:hypothetical protein
MRAALSLLLLAGRCGLSSASGTAAAAASTTTASATTEGPCDIFAKGGTPCVAAHSVVRAMYADYDGPLYSVRRVSAEGLPENTTQDIKPLSAGGVADAAAQDSYCNAPSIMGCTIAAIYDQSPMGNHLRAAPARRGSIDLEVNASADPLTLGGKKVYSAYFEPVADYLNATGGHEHATAVGVGYRNDTTTGVATGDEPETLYMVASGQHYNEGCCFDYGNAESFLGDAGDGTMEAISITDDKRGTMHGASHGVGPGPWVWGDLEQGLFVGNHSWPAPSLRDAENRTYPFVTAMIKGDSASASTPLGHWAIKGGDATAADGLKTLFDGPRPCAGKPPACLNKGNQSWSPMRKYGGIILGIGAKHTFFGAIFKN